LDRFKSVLSDRKPTPWGVGIGLSRGTISRILDGHTPGADSLTLITSNENINLTWLLKGDGNPFIVERNTTEKAAYEFLLEKLKENTDWMFYILTNGIETHVVLKRMNTYYIKDKCYEYPQIVNFMAYIMDAVLEHIAQYIEQQRVYLLVTNRQVLTENYQGKLGTFKLFGDDKHPGLLSEAILVTDKNQLKIDPVDTPQYNLKVMEDTTRFVESAYPDLDTMEKQELITRIYLTTIDATEDKQSLIHKLGKWVEKIVMKKED